jgi:hypothetical protein
VLPFGGPLASVPLDPNFLKTEVLCLHEEGSAVSKMCGPSNIAGFGLMRRLISTLAFGRLSTGAGKPSVLALLPSERTSAFEELTGLTQRNGLVSIPILMTAYL